MITEMTAAFTALKETIGLVKVINDAKNDAEIKAATFELQNKLLSLQIECFSLGDVIRMKDEQLSNLRKEIAFYEDFESKVEGYELTQLDSNVLVYAKDEIVGSNCVTLYLCPHCYSKNVKSMLQPINGGKKNRFHKAQCLNCDRVFLTHKNQGYERPMSMKELGRSLNG
ncbi:TPA: hypothetical protein J4786_001569 [Citrobacter amalonaticus]|nr:hypothetical protein [Citrobacter amalonaticus]HAZ4786166.1 hypothetical protein [Citrobacter amalonaticus]